MELSEDILTVALCFAGRELSEKEQGVLRTLCEAAEVRWKSRLREELSPEDCRGPFVTACAWTALAGFQGGMEAGRSAPVSFTAGDLTVRNGDADACGRSLEAQAQLLMEPYVEDGSFAFLEVRG